MKPADQAKAFGARSLSQVAEFSGYTLATLRSYSKSKPQRFKALCVAAVCNEVGLDGHQIRKMQDLSKSLRGEK